MFDGPSHVPESPRVLMYSDDILGLGHLRRNTTIASRLVREIPDASVLMLTGLPSGCFFELPEGIDFVKLPSVSKVATGSYQPRNLRISEDSAKSLRASTIAEIAHGFAPDLFLVDHMPLGIWGELLPTLQRLKADHESCRLVLGLRDILDAPSVTKRIWHDAGVYEAIEDYYDAVFVYGCPEVFETTQLYGLENGLASLVNYCGYLCAEDGPGLGGGPRREDNPDARKLVVVTAGGGYDGFPMMKLCIEAVQQIGPDAPFQLLLITGPFMDRRDRDVLEREASGLPIRLLHFVDDSSSYIEAADMVITMAGYNTLIDAVRRRKTVLVMPRTGPSAEQRMRTEIFSELGLVHPLDPEQTTAGALAELICEKIEDGPITAPLPRMDGLDNAVGQIRSLLATRLLELPVHPAYAAGL